MDGLVVKQGRGEVGVGWASGQKSPEIPAGHQVLGAIFQKKLLWPKWFYLGARESHNITWIHHVSPATTYILTELRLNSPPHSSKLPDY